MTKIDVKFSDDTKCDVTSSTDTEVKCVISGFKMDGLNAANPYPTTVTVNTVENKEKSVQMKSSKVSGQSLTPSSTSPVLA